jgi:hypothetical protein
MIFPFETVARMYVVYMSRPQGGRKDSRTVHVTASKLQLHWRHEYFKLCYNSVYKRDKETSSSKASTFFVDVDFLFLRKVDLLAHINVL